MKLLIISVNHGRKWGENKMSIRVDLKMKSAFSSENPTTDLWSQIIWITHSQETRVSEKGSFAMATRDGDLWFLLNISAATRHQVITLSRGCIVLKEVLISLVFQVPFEIHFYFTFGCISMTAVVALAKPKFTWTCFSNFVRYWIFLSLLVIILVLSWRSMWFYFYILCTWNFHFIDLCFLICCFVLFVCFFNFSFLFTLIVQKYSNFLLAVLGHYSQVVNL